MTNQYVILDTRAVVSVRGADNRTFLQGMISQDIERVGPETAAYGAFLTPQGKYLHDFCITGHDGAILLDCEAARADDLVARLSRYRLRADVALAVDPGLVVAVVFGGDIPEGLEGKPGSATAFASGSLFVDPRHAGLGCRAILPRPGAGQSLTAAGFEPGSYDAYESLRISLTVPDGSRDLDVEKTVLLEANFDILNGIDWNKGCYLGQELTARTKYRGLVKRRLVTVAVDGAPPSPGTSVESDGKAVGILHSVSGNRAIASLRIDALGATKASMLTAEGSSIRLL